MSTPPSSDASPKAPADKKALIIKVLAVVIVIAIVLVYRQSSINAYGTQHELVGTVAPGFSLPSLHGPEEIALSDYAGKVVLLDFWATWCGPCARQVRPLRSVEAAFSSDDFQLLSVNTDDESRQRRHLIHRFYKQHMGNFTTVMDDHRAQALYGARRIPMMVLIGRDGKIKRVFSGITNRSMLERAIAREI